MPDLQPPRHISTLPILTGHVVADCGREKPVSPLPTVDIRSAARGQSDWGGESVRLAKE